MYTRKTYHTATQSINETSYAHAGTAFAEYLIGSLGRGAARLHGQGLIVKCRILQGLWSQIYGDSAGWVSSLVLCGSTNTGKDKSI